jgi:zinc transport system substrate-binding protein
MRRAGVTAALVVAAILTGCSDKSTPNASGSGAAAPPRAPGPPRIVSTIPPVHGIIEPLLVGAPLHYQHTTLLPPGASEHGFEITPASMAALGNADLVVMVGLGMEPQVEKFLADHKNASRRVVVLADSVKSSLAPAPDGDDDHADHAHDHDDHHHAADPHIWLDPVLVKAMVGECAAALKQLTPAEPSESKRLEAAASDLLSRVEKVHMEYRTALANAPRRTIVVAHDAYGYLAKRYNLELLAITGLNAGEPQPSDVKRAADVIRDKHLTTIFIEPQLSPAAADRIAQATGAKTAILDPLGDGDWFKLMDNNLKALKDALGQKAPESAP